MSALNLVIALAGMVTGTIGAITGITASLHAKTSNKAAEKANKLAEEANGDSAAANKLSEHANQISADANAIAKRALAAAQDKVTYEWHVRPDDQGHTLAVGNDSTVDARDVTVRVDGHGETLVDGTIDLVPAGQEGLLESPLLFEKLLEERRKISGAGVYINGRGIRVTVHWSCRTPLGSLVTGSKKQGIDSPK